MLDTLLQVRSDSYVIILRTVKHILDSYVILVDSISGVVVEGSYSIGELRTASFCGHSR